MTFQPKIRAAISYNKDKKKPSQNDLAFSMKFACASEIIL